MFERGVAVVGLGYIGLPTGATLANHGIKVLGVDVDPHVVDEINAGRAPFAEPDLSAAVERGVAQGLLSAQLEVPAAEVYLIAVPTPFLRAVSALGPEKAWAVGTSILARES